MSSESIPEGLGTGAKLVVLTHSCDIVQPSYEVEPYIELLIANPVAFADGSKTKGKHPRRLQFPIEVNGVEEYYEVCIHEKVRIDRKLLENGSPDASCRISPGNVRRIGSWAGKRYHREAFPTEFDRRIIPKARKKLKNALEKYGADLTGIFIAMSPEAEATPAEDYRIILRLVAEREAVEDPRNEETLFKLVSQMHDAFGMCKGIEVVDLQIVSDAQFTLEDWRKTKLWNYDELSDAEAEDFNTLAI